MTMQMIMKGSDGYVIASDRQMVDEQDTRTTLHTGKIFHLKERGVLCMSAGDECAIRAAYDFLESVKSRSFDEDKTETDERLRGLCDARVKKEKEMLQARKTTLPEYNRSLLIFLYGLPDAQAWRVTIKDNSVAHWLDRGFIRGGAAGNLAWFFLQRYGAREMSVSAILPLVVHTLSMGHELEQIMVDGHEVLTYSNETRLLTPIADLQSYLAQSQTIDGYVRQQFNS